MRRGHSSHLRRRLGQPPGFTLIELMMALVLVAFGLLALSATSALVTREVGSARTRLVAALAARNRAEWLMATPCDILAGGAASHDRGVREWWSIERSGTSAMLRDSVVMGLPSGKRSLVLQSSRPC